MIYSGDEYFIVATGSIGTHPYAIPQEAVLSRDELIRRGLTPERINELCADRPPILRRATPEELSRAKEAVGITPEIEAAHTNDVEKREADYRAAADRVKASPAKAAAMLFDALHEW